ncbi:MAG: hypothetical protein Q8K46_06560, partial [Deltaproteobacteria bacterium]|nr:hypothetical protein [Deltaproteobacteria bacterium]
TRRPNDYSDYMKLGVVEYVAMGPELPFFIASVGNLMRPSTHLAPNEVYLNRSVAAFPKNYMVGSIRSMLFVSHFERGNIDWRWTINENNLEPLPMPWLRQNIAVLNRLTHCATTHALDVERNRCLVELQSESSAVYKDAWLADRHSYSQHLGLDFLIVPPVENLKK